MFPGKQLLLRSRLGCDLMDIRRRSPVKPFNLRSVDGGLQSSAYEPLEDPPCFQRWCKSGLLSVDKAARDFLSL